MRSLQRRTISRSIKFPFLKHEMIACPVLRRMRCTEPGGERCGAFMNGRDSCVQRTTLGGGHGRIGRHGGDSRCGACGRQCRRAPAAIRFRRADRADRRLDAKIESFVAEGAQGIAGAPGVPGAPGARLGGRLGGVRLASGEVVPATVALVGIGVMPSGACASGRYCLRERRADRCRCAHIGPRYLRDRRLRDPATDPGTFAAAALA